MTIAKPNIKPILFSEKLISKVGGEVFAKEFRRKFVSHIWLYCIDSKYRKVVNLSKWIRSMMDDVVLKQVAKQWKNYKNDKKVIYILNYVHRRSTYISDKKRFGTVEKWQTARQSFEGRFGDCEDMSILILVLCRLAGVPSSMIQLACGNVDNPNGKGKVGHAYVLYLPERDGVLRVLDWCYYYDKRGIGYRDYFAYMKKYDDPWFTVNDVRYFGRFEGGKW